MMRTFGAAAMLALATVMPVQEAASQDALGGAILGGAAGAILGGAITGRGSGAAAGALVGAATGAIIANEARAPPQRRLLVAWRLLRPGSVRQLVPGASALLLTAPKPPESRCHLAAVPPRGRS